MCRLAVFSGISDEVMLAWAMIELEQSMGGHGNGLFVEKCSKYMKGEHMSAAKLASYAADESKGDGLCIFHTRLASAGGIRDELCHPFSVEGDAGAFVVAHNGHWSQWASHSKTEERSDTQTMARHISEQGIGVLLSDVAKGSGMWLVYDCGKRKQYAIRRSGEFWLQWMEINGQPAFMHASEKVWAVKDHVKNYAKIHQDKVYEVLHEDEKKFGHVRERKVEAKDPTRERTYSTYYSYGKGSYGKGDSDYNGCSWFESTEKAYSEYDFHADGSPVSWNCYCGTKWTCTSCREYFESFGDMPIYAGTQRFDSLMDEVEGVQESMAENAAKLEEALAKEDEDKEADETTDVVVFTPPEPAADGTWPCGNKNTTGCENRTEGWLCEPCKVTEIDAYKRKQGRRKLGFFPVGLS